MGTSAVLVASGGGTYAWSNGATSPSINVSPTSNTVYTVTVTVGTCTGSAAHSLVVVATPTASVGSNVTISQGSSATLSAGGGGNYSWSNGALGATDIVNPAVTSNYCVYVNNKGCTDTACVTVFVTPLECNDGVYIPNAFSPNGDNENDFFRVYFQNILCVEYFKIFIYNRWGQTVFLSNDPAFAWDGAYPEMDHNTAVFTYYMSVRFKNGDEVNKKGNVSLIR
jgi:gliding motility-associated-like protein